MVMKDIAAEIDRLLRDAEQVATRLRELRQDIDDAATPHRCKPGATVPDTTEAQATCDIGPTPSERGRFDDRYSSSAPTRGNRCEWFDAFRLEQQSVAERNPGSGSATVGAYTT